MWRIMQHSIPDDFVVATGLAYSLEEFVNAAFTQLGLDWRNYVEIDNTLARPSEIMCNLGNAAKAHAKLGWKPNYNMPDIVRMMVDAECSHKCAPS
jgi:GDPmannose 4,6-dehydratase